MQHRQLSRLDDALERLRQRLPDLRARHGVTYLGVFGSYLHGEERPDSDLDLLVEFDDRPLSLLDVVALENELSGLLGVKVDLVEKRALRPAIGRCILEEVRAV